MHPWKMGIHNLQVCELPSREEEGDGVWEVRSRVGVGEKRAKERGCRGWAMVECQDKGCNGFG
jgi:hypothetical protein